MGTASTHVRAGQAQKGEDMPRQRWPVSAVFSVTLIVGCLLAAGHAAPVLASEAVLRVGGDVERPRQWTMEELAALPRHEVRARDRDGTEATFTGVALVDLLRLAGAPLGADLRGSNMATYLLVEAADNYRVVFALPELDPAFTDRVILLADHRDGQPLTTRRDRYASWCPGDKRHARWVRQVLSCTIRRAP